MDPEEMRAQAHILRNAMYAAAVVVEQLTIERDRLRQMLLDCIQQAASGNDDNLDSMCIGAYTEAMLYLAEHGLIEIEGNTGRRVIGKPAALNGGQE